MATIGDYTPQQMRDLIIKFYPGSYTPSTFGNATLNWTSRVSYSSTKDLHAAITAFGNGPYQDTTYIYLKYCEEYIIGYSQYGVQILKGKCYYGGIRDLGAFIVGIEKIVYHETADLYASIGRVFTNNLPASIGIETPVNLQAYVDVFSASAGNLAAFIHGFQTTDLSGYIRAMQSASLTAYLASVPPIDLPAYLKVWPMKQLPSSIYGWSQSNLAAYIYAIQKGDLTASIAGESPKDLRVILRAWVREAISDLGAFIGGLAYTDLPAIIRAKYLKDLPAYMAGEPAINLPGLIHGYDTKNLIAILTGVFGEYDLPASITATNNFKNLIGILKPRVATQVPYDLPAYIKGVGSGILYAYINPTPYVNLMAYLNVAGQVANLRARIIPKTIRLTSVLSVLTMEHMDLSAVINPSCIWSESRNLEAYLRTVYKGDLGAVLIGKKYDTQIKNLGARVGYADTYSYIDKLPISISVSTEAFRYIDVLPLLIKIFTDQADIGASIIGTYLYGDLTAAITGSYIDPHHFDNVKNKQKVSKLDHAGRVEWYEMVELCFKSIVEDYFYSSAGASAWKTDRLDRWILDVRSYIPQDLKLNTKRRLHKLKYIYDLRRFRSIDEAVKYAIDFVTDYPKVNLPAHVNPSGGFKNIQGILNVRRTLSESNSLGSSVVGTPISDIVLGYSDGGVDVV